MKNTVRLLATLFLAVSLLSGAEPIPTVIKGEAGPAYSISQISSMLATDAPSAGLVMSDKQQLFANIVTDLDYQNPNNKLNNHTGFSIIIYTPSTWLGAKRAVAAKEFRTFGITDVTADDRQSILRVIVRPDGPEYMTARGNGAEHVVLRSLDKTLVAQPMNVTTTTQEFWNAFGARASYGGLVAVFSLADLEIIRAAAASREFFVTVVGDRKNSNRDFEIKRKFFDKLGDTSVPMPVNIPVTQAHTLSTAWPWQVDRAQSHSSATETKTPVTSASEPAQPPATVQPSLPSVPLPSICYPVPASVATAKAENDFSGELFRVGNGVTAPVPTYKPSPKYNEESKKNGCSGGVLLSVVIDGDGQPHNIRVTKSLDAGLDQNAIDCVRQWHFKPAIKDGKPVNVQATILITFRLL